jgi:tellurite resistance protein TerC
MMSKFRYLKISLVVILSYVGFKMIISHYVKINTIFSLCVIVTILIVGILTSIEASMKDAKE